jgi:hypothetical protein
LKTCANVWLWSISVAVHQTIYLGIKFKKKKKIVLKLPVYPSLVVLSGPRENLQSMWVENFAKTRPAGAYICLLILLMEKTTEISSEKWPPRASLICLLGIFYLLIFKASPSLLHISFCLFYHWMDLCICIQIHINILFYVKVDFV